jgi:hypothetical protein
VLNKRLNIDEFDYRHFLLKQSYTNIETLRELDKRKIKNSLIILKNSIYISVFGIVKFRQKQERKVRDRMYYLQNKKTYKDMSKNETEELEELEKRFENVFYCGL